MSPGAFAPDLSRGSPWAAVPALDCSAADRAVAREWEMGFGGIPEKIRAYQEGTRRVKAFHVEYGAMDSYPWIRDGSEYLVACLREAGARVSSRRIEGQNHVYTCDQIQGRFASFWNENLAFQ